MSRRTPTYLFIADILDRVRDDSDAHVDQIGRSDLKHPFAELLAVLVDLLDSHRAHDCTLVSLQCDQGDVLNLSLSLAQELLASCQQHVLVLSLDLNLGNASDRDWYALTGVHAGALHCQSHCVQGDPRRKDGLLILGFLL